MATMTLPISQLGTIILEAEQAQADAKCVVSVSASAVATFDLTWEVVKMTLKLRHRLARIVEKQSGLIRELADADYSNGSPQDLLKLAEKIDSLIADERDVLADTRTMGVPIRVWWEKSLSLLESQVEHLDSISESLHIAADPEATSLIAMAVGQLTREPHFATQ